jgi:hypothetical protein
MMYESPRQPGRGFSWIGVWSQSVHAGSFCLAP